MGAFRAISAYLQTDFSPLGSLPEDRLYDNSGNGNTQEFCFLPRAQALRPYLGVSSFPKISLF